ncbi:SMC-Scp complex subunit ScpB [Pseudogemmobacter sonorensis]|uniref:SMC-Scp complex subunit ScpB n=1 Tax=Pseudogemmobacter sonorensis TaxID=2989681 RepID=UPI0036CE8DD9
MADEAFDRDLADLPPAERWRAWMARAEAVIFASAAPVTHEMLARVVGEDCVIALLVEDIANDLRDRPYEIARVAGGWLMRTRPGLGPAIRRAFDAGEEVRPLPRADALAVAAVAYLQPVTRGALSQLLGREVSRDTMARLHRQGLIARGPRSPEPGAPYTYVTTEAFLIRFGLESLNDLPDLEALADAGLLAPDPAAIPPELRPPVFGAEEGDEP